MSLKKAFHTQLRDSPEGIKSSKMFKPISPYQLYGSQFSLPKQFDARRQWAAYLSRIQDQGSCGASYAFALAGLMSDRIALLSLNKLHVEITAVDSVICQLINPDLNISLLQPEKIKESPNDVQLELRRRTFTEHEREAHATKGCQGNTLYNTAKYLYLVGATTTDCVPNSLITSGNFPTCEEVEDPEGNQTFDYCADHKTAQHVFRLDSAYLIDVSDPATAELNIMAEIYKWGPIAGALNMFEDFLEYDGKTIYTHPKQAGATPIGGHSVRIIGWGEEMQGGRLVKYWQLANCWGEQWGDAGYFKMERWLPGCELEQNIISGIPQLPSTAPMTIPSIIITPKEQDLINLFDIDLRVFYALSSIEKIKEGKQQGTLTPLARPSDYPAIDTFVAGKLGDGGMLHISAGWWILGLLLVAGILAGIFVLRRKN
jgi:cathepsin B